jgi:glycosyltransferase involved in cell wall biosynthesis
VVIPAWDEEKNIGWLVGEIRRMGLDVVVIDDGSGDQTFHQAYSSGAQVLRNEHNMGKGASLIKGTQYALERDYDVVITMDGDGQHAPADIPLFESLAESGKFDMVIGNRMSHPGDMPYLRVMTNRLMSWLISLVLPQKISDTQCGYRFIRRGVLEQVSLRCCNYEIESEMIIRAARRGFRIGEITIKTIYNKEKSRINPLIDSFRFLRFFIQELIQIKLRS